jgi:PAS domain S-box-containing protein
MLRWAGGRPADAPGPPAAKPESGLRRRGEGAEPHHLVQFYEDEAVLTESIARFTVNGLLAGSPVVIIATQAHLRDLEQRLLSTGFETSAARASGRLTCLDADELLSRFMRDGIPDARLFDSEIGTLIARQLERAGSAYLHAYGEMVDVLWKRGERSAALILEELWTGLQHKHSFTLLCAYAMAGFYKEPAELKRVCSAHTHVVESDSGSVDETTEFCAQRARLLAKDATQRDDVEAALREALRELQGRAQSLQESEEQLRDFVENATLGMHSVGPDGIIVWANRAELAMLGYAEHEYVGRPIQEFHVDELVISDILQRLGCGEALQDYEARMRAKDGSTKHVLISSSVYERDGRFVHTRCFTRDITEWKALDRFRQSAVLRAARLSAITGAIAEAVTPEQVFGALVDRLHEAIEATSTGLWLVDQDARVARLVRSIGYSDAAKRQIGAAPLDTPSPIPVLDAIRRGKALWIGSQAELIELYPHLSSVVSPDKAYSVGCLPLLAGGEVLGALGLTIDSGRRLDEDEREFLLLAARYASQAVERLRLFEAERRSRSDADAAARRLGILSQASRVFAETGLDLGTRLDTIVAELGTTLESAVGIALLKEDGLLHTCATFHPSPEAHALLKTIGGAAPLRVGEGITGSASSTGKSVLIADMGSLDVQERVAPAYREFLSRFPGSALICAALRAQGQIIGTVTALRAGSGAPYTSDDVELIEQLAERAATAIENSRLYQETVQDRLRAEQLYGFAEAVVVAETVETVYDAALDAIEAVLGAKRASVLTFDGAGVMRFVASRNLSEDYRRAVEGHSPWAPDATAPEPIVVADAKNDPSVAAYAPLFEREGIGALAFIPLVARRRLLGKFMVYYDSPHAFGAQELETARAIANHLASVISRFSAVSRLEDTVRGNELFAGVLAHDLLNPLAAIVTGAQLLLVQAEGEAADAQRGATPLQRILSSGRRMARMIDQLLDFTRARTGGGIEVQPRASHLGELSAQAVGELELAHPGWRIRRESSGDLTGTWDSDRLVQIISNLVANAGHHGHSEHDIVVSIDGSQADRVALEVRNAGTIPPAILPELFDPFRTTRVGSDRSRGLGLGLFIVGELVRAHGGRVDVVSEAGTTTFRVRMPRHVRSISQRAAP